MKKNSNNNNNNYYYYEDLSLLAGGSTVFSLPSPIVQIKQAEAQTEVLLRQKSSECL